jgi:hypothetical protein
MADRQMAKRQQIPRDGTVDRPVVRSVLNLFLQQGDLVAGEIKKAIHAII